jgi:hypothetical protein
MFASFGSYIPLLAIGFPIAVPPTVAFTHDCLRPNPFSPLSITPGPASYLSMATSDNHDDIPEEGTNSNSNNMDDDTEFYSDLQKAKQRIGEISDDDDTTNDDDDEFYRNLRKAKLEKLGGSIPPEQVREVTAQAEDDFLQAMKNTKDEFQRAKEELGSDGAVDFFLEKIQEEDRLREEEQEEE